MQGEREMGRKGKRAQLVTDCTILPSSYNTVVLVCHNTVLTDTAAAKRHTCNCKFRTNPGSEIWAKQAINFLH